MGLTCFDEAIREVLSTVVCDECRKGPVTWFRYDERLHGDDRCMYKCAACVDSLNVNN